METYSHAASLQQVMDRLEIHQQENTVASVSSKPEKTRGTGCERNPLLELFSFRTPQDYLDSFVYVARRICPDFTITPELFPVVCRLIDYAFGNGSLDPDKGIWFYGNIGTGKSTLLRVMKEYCRLCHKRVEHPVSGELRSYTYRITSIKDICIQVGAGGPGKLETFINNYYQAFDDVGQEGDVTYYGSKLNIFEEIILGRYNRRSNDFTHVTTNLDIPEMHLRYGSAAYDRIKEMFNFVKIEGCSFRGRS